MDSLDMLLSWGRNNKLHRIVTGKALGKQSLGRPKMRWENIKMDLREECYEKGRLAGNSLRIM
jgi:hypothetical protein